MPKQTFKSHRSLGAILLAVSAVLAGCGGGGGSNPVAVPAGRYVGSWTDGADDSGTVDLTVAADRTLSGIVTSSLWRSLGKGEAEGSIETDGRTEFDPTWPTPGSTLPSGSEYAGTLRYDPATKTLKGTLGRPRDIGLTPLKSAWTLTLQ